MSAPDNSMTDRQRLSFLDRLKVLLPGEGEGGGELEDGEVIVGGGAVIGGVGQPRAGGDGDLAVTGVSVVMLTHNNPRTIEIGSLF